MEKEIKIPQHVAVIMDGNGRWAKAKGLPRNYGHVQGARVVEQICEDAWNLGIKYLTIYAFSTENWSRPRDEVEALMKLLKDYLVNCIKRANKNNMRVRILGDKTGLANDIRDSIDKLEKATEGNTGLNFSIALNYGGRDELTRAFKKIAISVKNGSINEEDITPELITSKLDTQGIPDPDLLIRTCNEQRISNFLLWQIAYSELYFTPVAWPDFNIDELKKAVDAYNHRDRRFGGLKEGN